MCAGATSANASIASSTSSSTLWTPVRFAGVDRLEPDRGDVGGVLEDAELGVGELVEADLDGVAVVGDRLDQLDLAARATGS